MMNGKGTLGDLCSPCRLPAAPFSPLLSLIFFSFCSVTKFHKEVFYRKSMSGDFIRASVVNYGNRELVSCYTILDISARWTQCSHPPLWTGMGWYICTRGSGRRERQMWTQGCLWQERRAEASPQPQEGHAEIKWSLKAQISIYETKQFPQMKNDLIPRFIFAVNTMTFKIELLRIG